MSTTEAVNLETRILDITNDAEVRAAAELTIANWGNILRGEKRGGKSKRIEWVSEHLRERSRKFAEGQIVAYYEGKLVGIVNTNRITANSWEDIPKSWRDAAGNYVFKNYDPDGNVLICPNISVDNAYQKNGIASKLIIAVKDLASKMNQDAGREVIEGIVPYSRFRSYKSTKDAVREGKAMVVKIDEKYYVVKKEDVADDSHWQELSKYAIRVRRYAHRIKEFTPQTYIFFRRFEDLPVEYKRDSKPRKQGEGDMPYDDTPKFHARLGAVPIGIRKLVFDTLIPGIGYGGRPADRESGGHNPILLYDLTSKKTLFSRLVSHEHDNHFTKALDGIGRGGLYKYHRAA